MTAKAWLLQFIRRGTGLLAILWLLAPAASADCATDAYGEAYCGGGRCIRDHDGTVWCSRYYQGGAQTTRDGRVLCGKGQCAKSTRGEIFCSSVVGGAVLKDSKGRVRCQGRCEAATAAQCENTPADSAG
jgi:hypothetical protein